MKNKNKENLKEIGEISQGSIKTAWCTFLPDLAY